MSYLNEFEKEVRDRLVGFRNGIDQKDWNNWLDEFTKFLNEKVLESYKNGLEAAKSRANRKRGQPPRNLPTSSKEKA